MCANYNRTVQKNQIKHEKDKEEEEEEIRGGEKKREQTKFNLMGYFVIRSRYFYFIKLEQKLTHNTTR